jgi:uncharacterized protein DUF1592/uncharacterized protein DUF1588/uncharacterized protein DUF1585/uncharacterized protein DUF1587/uncharacterized protein DUF1595/cytochrome c
VISRRLLVWSTVLLLTGIAVPAIPQNAVPEEFAARIAPFLKKHCLSCHGPDKQKAQFRLDRVDGFRIGESHLWTRVHEQISEGRMPPEERPRPADAETRQVLSWIEREQKFARTGGTRRLNRREFSAALQDLTGLGVDYASALPGDGTLEGFDTGADGLQDAADSVNQSMQIARRGVEGIRFLDPAPRKPLVIDLRQIKDFRKAFDAWKSEGVTSKFGGTGLPGSGLLLQPQWLGDRSESTLFVAPPPDRRGIVRLKVVVSALKKIGGVPNPRLWVEMGGKSFDHREIVASKEQPQELTYEVQIEDLAVEQRGIGITLSCKVEVPYAVEGFENEDKSRPDQPPVPGGTGLFRPAFDRKKLAPDQQPVPFVILHAVEIDPDHIAPWPPTEWKLDVGKLGDDPESARRLLELWMDRAYRRPTTASEREQMFGLYREQRRKGASFDRGLQAAFQAVVLSAPFRYLASPADPDPVLAQHAIASRLSFMLVGAPPDQELRRLAAQGRLRDRATLDAQAERLLADPRSASFIRSFVSQWLELGQPITIAMDHIQKQDFRFGRHLKASMTEETVAYVGELLRANRPARELISSDWTMMNDILARHYGYEGIQGGELRKVTLRSGDPRGGGILGHAGIQSMLCWMGDNWVIYRGAWALRHILDAPPPPPPLEVPELNPSDAENHGKTFKELLRRHQQDPKCSTCHATIDPLGFAFQNFDISGRWREVEHEKYEKKELDGKIEWHGAGRTRPVDTVGRLPRGEEFKSFAEWREIVVRNYRNDLVRGLMKNLLIYATGRRPDVADLTEVRAILKEQAPKDYPLRELFKALLRSRAFLGRE